MKSNLLSKYSSNLSQEYLRDKIEGKKILVMGSGPSVDSRNWAALDFDYIATVSFWYNREDLLKRSDVLFTAYSALVNFSDTNLLNYLDTHETIVGIEDYKPVYTSTLHFNQFKNRYKNKYVGFQVNNRIPAKYMGIAGRLLFFIINFNPSTIYYVGIDGVSENPKDDPSNSFRMGLRSNTAKGVVGIDDVAEIRRSHLNMAQNIHEECSSRNISLYNLGEGLPFNMSGEYSKIHYPLNQEIIKLIEK
jgi:hypothetical protein